MSTSGIACSQRMWSRTLSPCWFPPLAQVSPVQLYLGATVDSTAIILSPEFLSTENVRKQHGWSVENQVWKTYADLAGIESCKCRVQNRSGTTVLPKSPSVAVQCLRTALSCRAGRPWKGTLFWATFNQVWVTLAYTVDDIYPA